MMKIPTIAIFFALSLAFAPMTTPAQAQSRSERYSHYLTTVRNNLDTVRAILHNSDEYATKCEVSRRAVETYRNRCEEHARIYVRRIPGGTLVSATYTGPTDFTEYARCMHIGTSRRASYECTIYPDSVVGVVAESCYIVYDVTR
jgi:hypothetical protein